MLLETVRECLVSALDLTSEEALRVDRNTTAADLMKWDSAGHVMLMVELEDGHRIPHSAETYEELRTFVHGERGKMGGLPGRHDDRVMGLSLANVAAKQGGIGSILFG